MSDVPGHLVLVRHARTIQDPTLPSMEWKLGAEAEDDCRALAHGLTSLKPSRVLTSSHQKAIGTGRFLAEALGLEWQAVEGLEEQDRSGVPFTFDGTAWLATIRRVFEEPDQVVLGNESATQALERFEGAVRREVENHPGETLVLASHATVMALFVARHNGFEAFPFWSTLGMPEAVVLRLPDFTLQDRLLPSESSVLRSSRSKTTI